MMTAPARRPRRRSGHGAESPTLARLAAAREQLDAEIVERRRREDEQLTEYAAATDAVTELHSPTSNARPPKCGRRRSRSWRRSKRGRARSWWRCMRIARPKNWPRWSAFRSGGYAPFCARTGSRPRPRSNPRHPRTHRRLGRRPSTRLPGPRPAPRRRRTTLQAATCRSLRPRRCQMPTRRWRRRRRRRRRTALHPPPEQRGETVSQVAARRSPHRAVRRDSGRVSAARRRLLTRPGPRRRPRRGRRSV